MIDIKLQTSRENSITRWEARAGSVAVAEVVEERQESAESAEAEEEAAEIRESEVLEWVSAAEERASAMAGESTAAEEWDDDMGKANIYRAQTIQAKLKGPTQGSPACAAPNGPVVVYTPTAIHFGTQSRTGEQLSRRQLRSAGL
uniref:Uncharacterized protein n=1 Tax=Ananas comosus var. bracteatus TaxID=296719 RepID=A0A6V7PUD4_ANACO|nr:unnamed protein product [Ananas comosus var. bracteatus]